MPLQRAKFPPPSLLSSPFPPVLAPFFCHRARLGSLQPTGPSPLGDPCSRGGVPNLGGVPSSMGVPRLPGVPNPGGVPVSSGIPHLSGVPHLVWGSLTPWGPGGPSRVPGPGEGDTLRPPKVLGLTPPPPPSPAPGFGGLPGLGGAQAPRANPALLLQRPGPRPLPRCGVVSAGWGGELINELTINHERGQ